MKANLKNIARIRFKDNFMGLYSRVIMFNEEAEVLSLWFVLSG